MIDFPDNPVHGSTYTYQNIQYAFINPNPTDSGYWAVKTPSTVGVATPTEIDEGTDNSKYASPQGLNGSKYVREDEVSGETVLNSGGAERLKANATGVEVTGKLVLGGDTMKDTVKVGFTTLFSGIAYGTEDIPLSKSLAHFDAVIIYGRNSEGGSASSITQIDDLLGAGNSDSGYLGEVLSSTKGWYGRVQTSSSSNTSLRIYTGAWGFDNTTVTIYKVVGVKSA